MANWADRKPYTIPTKLYYKKANENMIHKHKLLSPLCPHNKYELPSIRVPHCRHNNTPSGSPPRCATKVTTHQSVNRVWVARLGRPKEIGTRPTCSPGRRRGERNDAATGRAPTRRQRTLEHVLNGVFCATEMCHSFLLLVVRHLFLLASCYY